MERRTPTNYQRIISATRTMEKALTGYFVSDWIIKVEKEIEDLGKHLNYFNDKEEISYYCLKDLLFKFKNRKGSDQRVIVRNHKKRYERRA